jgi:lipopolysaccharide transport system ATP-binding protein
MSGDVVVSVEDLGKRFKIYANPWDRAREWLSVTRRSFHTDFWALRNISFEVRRGEALGIIGQNGAGKSTLLKILNGGLFATEGRFASNGRVLSILELGTGFNKDLSGPENIYYSAHLLGFPKDYVDRYIGDIEQFAELGDFFDRPLRMYSTGMRARLAFSMFAFLECDLLIIDEVLSVGDTFFTQKCYERLDQLRAQNTAMIMVTHNTSIIQQYCQRAIVLDKGRLAFAGTPAEAATHYFYISRAARAVAPKTDTDTQFSQPTTDAAQSSALVKRSPNHPSTNGQRDWAPGQIAWPAEQDLFDLNAPSVGEGWARCTAVAQCDDQGKPCNTFRAGQLAHWYYEFEALQDLYVPNGVITIVNEKNIRVHGKNTIQLGVRPNQPLRKGMRMRIHQSITLNLAPGEYTFSIGLTANSSDDHAVGAASGGFLASDVVRAGSFQIIPPSGPHLGLCDLPGACEVELCSSIYPPTPDLAIHG